ncbi:MAG: amidohydrolase family protein [Candidatus Moduliflexus flocculans]|nr:amidohydrolase family protein [Candidatus Moduliflexus flocculans]
MKLLYNARIYTQNPAQPAASAIVIDRDRILAVGGTDELFNRFTRAQPENMDGRVILPGLTDAHIHLKAYALGLQKVECETDTKEECLRRVAERAKTTKPGEWILGHGWNQNTWLHSGRGERGWPHTPPTSTPSHRTTPSISPQNRCTPDGPTPPPCGWRTSPPRRPIHSTDRSSATCTATRPASCSKPPWRWSAHIIPDPSEAEIADAMEKAQPILWKMGLTGVHDFDRRDSFMALQHAPRAGQAQTARPQKPARRTARPGARTRSARRLRRRHAAHRQRSRSSWTARSVRTPPPCSSPTSDEENNRGILNMDGEELFEHGRKAAGVGLGMTVHAIGDRANHEVLERLRAAPQLRA